MTIDSDYWYDTDNVMIHYMNNNNNIDIGGWWILDHNSDSDNDDENDDSDTDYGNDDNDDDGSDDDHDDDDNGNDYSDGDDDDANIYDKTWWFDYNIKIN